MNTKHKEQYPAKRSLRSHKVLLLLSTASFAFGSPAAVTAQEIDCAALYPSLPEECVQPNAGTTVSMEAAPNTEFEAAPVTNASGFVFSIDGAAVNADPRVIAPIRQTDIKLARADISVTFDGLGVEPRLDLEYVKLGSNQYQFQSRLNYPGYVKRAEIRVIDLDAIGGAKVVQVIPVDPNGQAAANVPTSDNLAVVHRVYDADGRFDETNPISLANADSRGLVAGVEDGTDNTAIRRISVSGGAVTVSSNNVAPNSVVSTLGERVTPTRDGSFVIQRILPPGEYDIDVNVNGAQNQAFSRRVDIPNSEWFYTAIGDVTIGRTSNSLSDDAEVYTRGRFAGYANGKLANGTEITASIDTQEEDFDNILSNLAEKDPRLVVGRIDPYSVYRVFGDDSTSVDDTPTSGRIYFKAEKDENFVLWGDYQAQIEGNEFIRNNRTLYGAQGQYVSQAQTSKGDPVFKAQAYAAQPDTLSNTETFRGTGGTVYFLTKQDINHGTTNLTVEVRDSETMRVIERRRLVEGVDYTVNHIQGSIVLRDPLSGTGDSGLVELDPAGDTYVNLVADYEFTPTSADVDGFAYGGRAEARLGPNVRLGVSGKSEEVNDNEEQIVIGADALYEFGARSNISVSYAQSEGPGNANTISVDGGLIVDTVDAAANSGSGEAYNVEANIDLEDIGLQTPGYVKGYFQNRTEGFANGDYTVTDSTGDETLYGLSAEAELSARLAARLAYDHYENDVDESTDGVEAEIDYIINDKLAASLGVGHINKDRIGEQGSRTDLAGRLTYTHSDQLEVYGFAQGTISNDGLEENNRAGVGGSYRFNDRWAVEGEIYSSDFGVGGKALANYQLDDSASLYFGYERDPAREVVVNNGDADDYGRFTFGGQQKVNDKVSHYTESRLDLYSEGLSLTGAYGVNYNVSQYLRYELAVEGGRVLDPYNGDLDRLAVSLGAFYEDARLSGSARAEYRQDRGSADDSSRDADIFIFDGSGRYKYSEDARLAFGLSVYNTDTDQSSVLDGTVIDGNISYAYRPVDNDKLNVLAGYRYYHDMYGQRVDGEDDNRMRQKSHVFSIDGEYEIDEQWTIGAKLGARLSEVSADQTSEFYENNAALGVVTARYHVVHNWDLVGEARVLTTFPDGSSEAGGLLAAYRHFGNNFKAGIGYNFSSFSDDLTDLTYDDGGIFVNFIAKF